MSTTDTQTELKASFDISHLDYGLLMLLSQIPERVERMTTLADTFGVDPSSITYRARRVELQGLVEQCSDGSDGRVVFLRLTNEGLALLREAQLVHVQSVRSHFLDHLDPTQLQFIETIFSNLQAIQRPSAVNAYME